ncbi:MAG: amino acid--tRNA ligase-related protein [Gammaproteobacteria bacterium]
MAPSNHLELWRPAAEKESLLLRARLLEATRQFFAARSVLEVQTPLASRYTTSAPFVQSMNATAGSTERLWLRTSPEHHMKRLIAAGSGDIWQLGSCFRAGEQGRYHNVEFQMLEWYRMGYSLSELWLETMALLQALFAVNPKAAQLFGFNQPICMSYRDFFIKHWQIDPFTISAQSLHTLAQKQGAGIQGAQGSDGGASNDRDYLLQRALDTHYPDSCLTLFHFPVDQAELAAIERTHLEPAAARFEIWINALEIANGAVELLSAAEAQKRIKADNAMRKSLSLEPLEPDHNLLGAMEQGLPPCAGTAAGFDRILMLLSGVPALSDCLAFPSDRA